MFKRGKPQQWHTTGRGSSGTCTSRLFFFLWYFVCDTLDSHFYLDTPGNARNNRLSATSRHEDAKGLSSPSSEGPFPEDPISCDRITKENGGQIAELEDAKLKHVVSDKWDDSTRRELMKRTSKYGLLHLVPASFLAEELTRMTNQSTGIWFCRGMHRGKHHAVKMKPVSSSLTVVVIKAQLFVPHRLHALSQTNQGQVTLPSFVLDINRRLGMRSCLGEEGEGDRLVGLLVEVTHAHGGGSNICHICRAAGVQLSRRERCTGIVLTALLHAPPIRYPHGSVTERGRLMLMRSGTKTPMDANANNV